LGHRKGRRGLKHGIRSDFPKDVTKMKLLQYAVEKGRDNNGKWPLTNRNQFKNEAEIHSLSQTQIQPLLDSMSDDGWFERLMQDTNPLYQLTDKGFEAFNKFNEIQQNCGSLKSLDIFRLWKSS
jgi:DNA-binding MarR family transcriptional regulator